MRSEYTIRQTLKAFNEIVSKLIDKRAKPARGYTAEQVVKKSLESLEKKNGSLSRGRIIDYLVASTYRFRKGRGRVNIKSILGPKSVERFSSDKKVRYYEDQWLQSAQLSRVKLINMIEDKSTHPQSGFIHMPIEESTKERMLNTQVGYLICQMQTLGWDPDSESCSKCEFVDRCKIDTQKKFPEIYRLRIEQENG